MELKHHFEIMIRDHLPDADLRRDEQYPAFYRDQAVQTAWAGFQAVHSELVQNTTKGVSVNHEDERR